MQYQVAPLLYLPAGKNLVLASHPDETKKVLVPLVVAELLQSCGDWRSLSEHSKNYWRSLRFSEKRERILPLVLFYRGLSPKFFWHWRFFEKIIEEILAKFVREEFLLSKSDFIEIKNQTRTNPTAKISTLCLTTQNRPDALRLSLESFIMNAQTFGRELRYSVYDGSESLEIQKQNESVLLELKKKYGVSIFYSGPKERETYFQQMKSDDLNPELLGFAIGHQSLGELKNSALLDHVGEFIFLTTDEISCKIRDHLGEAKEEDFLARHENIFSKSLKQILAAQDNLPTKSDLNLWKALRTPAAKVIASFPSIFETQTQTNPNQKEDLTIISRIPKLPPAYALDNSEGWLPDFPFGKSSDELSANLISIKWPLSYFAKLPISLEYTPNNKGDSPPQDPAEAVLRCLQESKFSIIPNSEKNLKVFANHLETFAESPIADIKNFLSNPDIPMKDEDAQQIKRHTKAYSKALKHWPEIISKAQAQRKKEMPSSKEI